MVAIVIPGPHHLGQHVDYGKHRPVTVRCFIGNDLLKDPTKEAKIRGNAYSEPARTLRCGRLICLLLDLSLVLSNEGKKPSLDLDKRASSTPHRDQRLQRAQYPFSCGFRGYPAGYSNLKPATIPE